MISNRKYSTWLGISLICFTLVYSSCSVERRMSPDTYLSAGGQEAFKYSVARYLYRLPEGADHQTKFDSQYDDYYWDKAAQSTLDYYSIGKKDTIYFQVSKAAPSLQGKRVATGGKMLRGDDGHIIYYEELYRSWKMDSAELATKSKLLFQKMRQGEDLSPYYPNGTIQEEYIQFPDAHSYYDVQQRQWRKKF